jgi:hypothetical protein
MAKKKKRRAAVAKKRKKRRAAADTFEVVIAPPAIKHTVEPRLRPLPRLYHWGLITEARRRGLGPLPRPNAVNKPWRRYLERRIGQAVVLERIFPPVLETIFPPKKRKRGQRGPGKQPGKLTATSKKKLEKQRARYQSDKHGIGSLLAQPKKKPKKPKKKK